MNVLLLSSYFDAARGPEPGAEGDSAWLVLRELGCEVVLVSCELGGVAGALPLKELKKKPVQAIVVDARDRLETSYTALRQLREEEILAQVPALLVVTLHRLANIDFRAIDDFVLHPVVPPELYARLRQLDWRFAAFAQEEAIKIGDLHIDLAGYAVYLRDRKLDVTHQEFELLKFLASHRGKVWTREQLLSKVWGYRYYGGTRTVDIHVRRLRAKLGATAESLIETVRNVGYKMRS